jgi:hypothetical protein
MHKILFQYPLLILLSITILFFGCQSPEAIKKHLIAGSTYKLWQKIKDTSNQKGIFNVVILF